MYQIHKDLKSLSTKIDKCKPDPKNARTGHSIEGIAESLKKYGQRKPIVVNKKTNIIEAGNGTWNAAKSLGWKNIAALFVEDSPEAATGFAIADNRLSDMSVFDAEILHELFDIVSPADIPGVDDNFLSEIGYIEDGPGTDGTEPNPKDDILPEKPKAICKVGQLWQLGEHRLLCGDCTDKKNVERLMDGEKADMIFTDPPYGIGIDGQKKSICKNPKHNRKEHEFMGWDGARPEKKTFEMLLGLKVPTVFFGGNYFADLLPASRGWIYWSKGQDGLSMSDGELT